jgi:pseudouridine synthase
LDKDSHGLLLLTNDPKLVNEFEHPKFEIEKEYMVTVDIPVNSRDVQKMKEGIEDEGETLKVARVVGRGTRFDIILNEGKKRHIRRMFRALGYKVLDLQRIREGNYELGKLKLGAWVVSVFPSTFQRVIEV